MMEMLNQNTKRGILMPLSLEAGMRFNSLKNGLQ